MDTLLATSVAHATPLAQLRQVVHEGAHNSADPDRALALNESEELIERIESTKTAVRQAESADTVRRFRSAIAEEIARCGLDRIPYQGPDGAVRSVPFRCNHKRLCSRCARHDAYVKSDKRAWPILSYAYKGMPVYSATLTQPKIEGEPVRESVHRLLGFLNTFWPLLLGGKSKRGLSPCLVSGIETTVDAEGGYHTHVHIVFPCPYIDKGFVRDAVWRHWKSACPDANRRSFNLRCELGHLTAQDGRRVESPVRQAIAYATKRTVGFNAGEKPTPVAMEARYRAVQELIGIGQLVRTRKADKAVREKYWNSWGVTTSFIGDECDWDVIEDESADVSTPEPAAEAEEQPDRASPADRPTAHSSARAPVDTFEPVETRWGNACSLFRLMRIVAGPSPPASAVAALRTAVAVSNADLDRFVSR